MDMRKQYDPNQVLPEVWENETEDGGVRKWKIRNGYGSKPKVGQKIAIHYKSSLEDGTLIESTYEEGEPFDFVLGKKGIKAWEIVIPKMNIREKAKLIVKPEYAYGAEGNEEKKVPANATIVIEFEVLYILEDLQKDDAIKLSEKLNQEANAAFHEKNFEQAAVLYHEAHQTISIHLGDDITPIIQKLRSNLSTCYARLGKWGQSLHYAENFLRWDKDNLKCLMRQLDAYIALSRIDEAEEVLEKCLKLSNNDPAFLAKRKQIKKAEDEMKKAGSSAYSKLAGKKIFG